MTPQSDDWLVDINHDARRVVVDPVNAKPIAEAYLGIVTDREMAKCLAGFAGARSAMRTSWTWPPPRGSRPTTRGATTDVGRAPSWGIETKLAFTNPSTSTSGRNVLVTLYAMATGIDDRRS